VDISLEATFDQAPSAVLAEVADLPGYPAWHGMVKRVEPDGDGWLVDLGARLGPFTRTKRVRLVRAADEAEGGRGRVRFVRHESDREEYGGWELQADVDPASGAGPCTLRFRLLYDGSSPLIGMLEPILRAETQRSADRLRQRLATG
jgi:hypothetical protein